MGMAKHGAARIKMEIEKLPFLEKKPSEDSETNRGKNRP